MGCERFLALRTPNFDVLTAIETRARVVVQNSQTNEQTNKQKTNGVFEAFCFIGRFFFPEYLQSERLVVVDDLTQNG